MAYTGIYNPWKLFDGMYTSDGYAKIYSPDEIHFHPDCLSFRNESRAICTDSEFTVSDFDFVNVSVKLFRIIS